MTDTILEAPRAPTRATVPRVPHPVALNLAVPERWADTKTLYNVFKWLRAKMPLAMVEMPSMDPFWVVTKHADILEISRQNELFLSGARPINLTNRESEAHIRNSTGGRSNFIETLLDIDGDYHRKRRLLTQRWFMSQHVRTLEDRVRSIAVSHLEEMARAGGQCDFAQDIAWTYPLYVLLDMLGLPKSTAPPLLTLTQQFLANSDPDLKRQGGPVRANGNLSGILAELWSHLKPFADERRANPGDDLLSMLATGQVDGDFLPEDQLMGYVLLLILAGHDSTSFAMAGGVMGLCQFPEEFAKLQADPALVGGAVEEAIRWITPVKHFMRTATVDYELRGQTIRPGDWLMLAYPSGNRDEDVFEEPEAFRIGRSPNRHLSFGHGVHLCLGQHLAKLELRILFEELRTRLTSLEFAGEPAITEASGVGGPKRLPIRYTLA